jgi:hypothetical protein
MASYPTAPATFPARVDASTIFANHLNAVQDEVAATEGALLGSLLHAVILGQSLTLPNAITPPQITANVNNYTPTGLSTAFQLRASADAGRVMTGLAAQAAGRLLLLTNVGASASVLSLPHNDALSAAGNRFYVHGAATVDVPSGGSALLYYDGVSAAWRVTCSTAAIAAAAGGTWADYTPAWTSTGTQPALGNGTLTGRFAQVGKTVFVILRWVLGSTSTQGTGTWAWSLPPGLPALVDTLVAHGRTTRTLNTLCHAVVDAAVPTRVNVAEDNTSGFIGPGAPSFASGATITLALTYETP